MLSKRNLAQKNRRRLANLLHDVIGQRVRLGTGIAPGVRPQPQRVIDAGGSQAPLHSSVRVAGHQIFRLVRRGDLHSQHRKVKGQNRLHFAAETADCDTNELVGWFDNFNDVVGYCRHGTSAEQNDGENSFKLRFHPDDSLRSKLN